MYEPSYERFGPSSCDIRDDIEKRTKESIMKKDKYVYDGILKQSLDVILPENRNDYGSWRGYYSYRMNITLSKHVEIKYNKLLNESKNKLESKFLKHCLYKLYNPNNGLMVKHVKKNFETYLNKQ